MSVTLALFSSIAAYFSTGNNDDGPCGADAVRTAVNEIETIRDRNFTATLGEPDIVEDYGRYFKDPKVVIPVLDSPFDGANRLVFDLPEGRDDDYSTFNELLALFDIEFESMEALDGEEVPMTFVGGNASVVWDQLKESSDKAGDDDDDSNVNVEETTISGDDSDDA